MQKVTAFLEQHVQWIAIGLGALFCLYMIYGYVITPPAVAELDLNPVLGFPDRAVAVDARVRIRRPQEHRREKSW